MFFVYIKQDQDGVDHVVYQQIYMCRLHIDTLLSTEDSNCIAVFIALHT